VKRQIRMKCINRLVRTIKDLTPEEQSQLLQQLFFIFDEDRKRLWVDRALYLACPGSRWSKVERWMEAQFRKDMKRLPIKVASMSIHYFKINSRMFPFLIKTAQRVKNRVWMRKKRERERLEEGE